ncbi:hypothetical protein [Methanomethylovorans sp. PtaU1.Bin093]|jgi:hypothetical protein|uniref:hypothetical protein n=1 Tax=Methanomethylovorans sp. PtaU1.Bin093 TaxID=1811679 RepID=UPI0025F29D38|nr:hypothetical protein [Methanomethylovorans sp. PtaU1.Bin093]
MEAYYAAKVHFLISYLGYRSLSHRTFASRDLPIGRKETYLNDAFISPESENGE